MFLGIWYSQNRSRDSRGSRQGGIKLLDRGCRRLCMYDWGILLLHSIFLFPTTLKLHEVLPWDYLACAHPVIKFSFCFYFISSWLEYNKRWTSSEKCLRQQRTGRTKRKTGRRKDDMERKHRNEWKWVLRRLYSFSKPKHESLSAFWGLLNGDGLLLAHSTDNGD